ncbi:hypothetical protein [Paraburkholderia sp. JPY419]|uniref:hypothetical protein n=1 Tax=Paraburkholderia sp. JPY419 TaxID=667660 RepID=UPI003D1E7562
MLADHRLHALQREHQLRSSGLLRPQRAVIVEHGDPVGSRNEVLGLRRRHQRDEIADRPLRRRLISGRERRGCRCTALSRAPVLCGKTGAGGNKDNGKGNAVPAERANQESLIEIGGSDLKKAPV